jgi:LacI family transcriptional regulator
MVTMLDVAKRAGVTKQTVSNVVTGRVVVSPKTRAKVEAAITELGYTPNLVARGLATGTTMTIGFLVPTVANPFYSEVVEEVENVLDSRGYHLLLCTTRGEGERARRHLASLGSRSIDALLIAGDQQVEDHLGLLASCKFPVALCAWEIDPPDTLPVVTIDYEQAGFLAGRHLRDLGHERVAVIADLPAHARRVDGLRRAFARDGLTLPDDAVITAPQSSPEGGFEAASAALTGALPSAGRPTAIFASHDILALGALDAARQLGLCVPEDLSVVGLDDIDQARRAHPALTTVAIPKREMAQQVVELLLRAISEQQPPPNAISLLRPRLIARESSTTAHS